MLRDVTGEPDARVTDCRLFETGCGGLGELMSIWAYDSVDIDEEEWPWIVVHEGRGQGRSDGGGRRGTGLSRRERCLSLLRTRSGSDPDQLASHSSKSERAVNHVSLHPP
jgi:hypothetical protein